MELQKLLKRFKNLDSSLEKAYKKDIKQIIQNILEEYDVFYKNTSDKVTLEEFNNIFTEEEDPICLGISKNGNKCCRKSQPHSNYCKMHFYLEFNKKLNEENNIFIINKNVEKTEILNKGTLPSIDMEKIFIEDSFYYKDKEFIYDTSNFNKVGYIQNEQVFLTDDPFILGV
jgi:Fe-S-cluster containining protein